MYLGHPEGAVDEMIGLTNESIMSELIDGTEAEDDNRPGKLSNKPIRFLRKISLINYEIK